MTPGLRSPSSNPSWPFIYSPKPHCVTHGKPQYLYLLNQFSGELIVLHRAVTNVVLYIRRRSGGIRDGSTASDEDEIDGRTHANAEIHDLYPRSSALSATTSASAPRPSYRICDEPGLLKAIRYDRRVYMPVKQGSTVRLPRMRTLAYVSLPTASGDTPQLPVEP